MNWSFWTRTRPSAFLQDGPDSCDDLDPLLALYADRMASPEEARSVEAHLPNCEDCREALQWMQATRRALASRPVVLPPASLQAQIARAIAASPSAPARTFSLRPAYAAAASLAIAGTVLGGHFLLTARSVAPPTVKPSQVASLPPKVSVPGVPHPLPALPIIKHSSHPGIKPLPAPTERLAAVPDESPAPDLTQPRSVSLHFPHRSLPAPVMKRNPAVAMPSRPKIFGTVMAKLPPKPVEHAHAAPLPIVKKPDTVMAALPPAVSIGPSTITPQEAPRPVETTVQTSEGHFQTASLLGSVQDYALKHQSSLEHNLSRAGSTAIRGAVHTTEMTTGLQGSTAYLDGIHTP